MSKRAAESSGEIPARLDAKQPGSTSAAASNAPSPGPSSSNQNAEAGSSGPAPSAATNLANLVVLKQCIELALSFHQRGSYIDVLNGDTSGAVGVWKRIDEYHEVGRYLQTALIYLNATVNDEPTASARPRVADEDVLLSVAYLHHALRMIGDTAGFYKFHMERIYGENVALRTALVQQTRHVVQMQQQQHDSWEASDGDLARMAHLLLEMRPEKKRALEFQLTEQRRRRDEQSRANENLIATLADANERMQNGDSGAAAGVSQEDAILNLEIENEELRLAALQRRHAEVRAEWQAEREQLAATAAEEEAKCVEVRKVLETAREWVTLFRECTICKLEFGGGEAPNKPQVLQCGHTVCAECVGKVRMYDEIKCPCCSELFNWIEPPTNFHVVLNL